MTAPYYADDAVTLHHGDCLDVLRTLPDASVDAVVTDPPYGLADHTPAVVAKALGAWLGGDREHVPDGRGFMGRDWDRFVPPPAVFDECLRVLKPGGHLLCFAGSRTVDLMTTSVRFAGFEIRDGMAWLYGSGFPKSLDVSKAIDKAAGAEREIAAPKMRPDGRTVAQAAVSGPGGNFVGDDRPWKHDPGAVARNQSHTAPATMAAQQWQGWGTALKPAFEPVVCARKPFSAVPLGGEADRLHHLIGALLWQAFTPAKRAVLSSPSSHHEPPAAWCVSARIAAALKQSPGASEPTDTFSSPALASTSSSIVSSWSAILAALSGQTRTSTTSTASSTTTALRTLSSLLAPVTSPTTMPSCGCLTHGPSSSAKSAEGGSSDDWSNWLHTLSASAPATATEGIALAAASVLAQVAESLSSDRAAGSSADPSATTGADARGSRPAFEPIVVGRKPFPGTVAANVLEHGTGALNIDGCRVGNDERTYASTGTPGANSVRLSGGDGRDAENARRYAAESKQRPPVTVSGRWPTNVVLDESQAAELDKQTGVLHSQDPETRKSRSKRTGVTEMGTGVSVEYADQGGASRFFPVFRYEAKAPTSERPRDGETAHPTVKPLDLMRWLVRLVTPPGGTVLEPFAGSGTTAEACVIEGFRCIAIEREADYLPLIVNRLSKPIQIGLDFEGGAA